MALQKSLALRGEPGMRKYHQANCQLSFSVKDNIKCFSQEGKMVSFVFAFEAKEFSADKSDPRLTQTPVLRV